MLNLQNDHRAAQFFSGAALYCFGCPIALFKLRRFYGSFDYRLAQSVAASKPTRHQHYEKCIDYTH